MWNEQSFLDDVRLQVKASAAQLGDYEHVCFTTWCLERLSEANEVIDLTASQYEGVGKSQRKLRLDAFGYDQVDDSMVAVISDYSDASEVEIITKTEVETLFRQLTGFIETALDGDRVRDFEHSSQAASAAFEFRAKIGTASKVKLYLVTNKRLSERLRSLPDGSIAGLRSELNVWDITRFLDNREQTVEVDELEIDFREWFPDGIPALRDDNPESPVQTYLMVVPGYILADLYDRHGTRLLEGNVRSFLSLRGAVNKGIKATILQEPERFLAYNNGLSTTATDVQILEREGRVTVQGIRGLQIVNGGQTTVSLFTYKRQEKEKLDQLDHVFVQMKLIVVPPEKGKEMVPNIARYANTQNRISEADFFSNSPFHVRMEETSKRISSGPRPGEVSPTRWFYERARGAYQNEKIRLGSKLEVSKFEKVFPSTQVITKTDLAKFYNSWNQKPQVVSRGAQKNFITFANEIAEKYLASPELFADDFYKRIVGQAILYNSVRKAVMQSPWYESGYLANIVAYAIARLSYELEKKNLEPDWNEVWKLASVDPLLISSTVEIARKMKSVLTSESRLQQNVSEWAKLDKAWEAAKAEKVELSADLISSLSRVTATEKRARVREERERGGALGEIENLVKLQSIPIYVWDEITTAKSFSVSPAELGILKVLGEGKALSSLQQQKLLDLLERAKLNGIISTTI